MTAKNSSDGDEESGNGGDDGWGSYVGTFCNIPSFDAEPRIFYVQLSDNADGLDFSRYCLVMTL